MSAIFSAPLFGLAAPLFGYADDADGRRRRIDSFTATVVSAPQVSKPVKTAVYLLSVAGALGAFMLLNEVAGGGSGLPHFSDMAVGTSELAWALPVIALGACAGWLFHGFGWAVGKLSARLGDRVVVKAVVAGAILGVLGIFLPFTLFAGEAQTEMLAQQWTALGAGALLATGFLKVLASQVCLGLGWRGGHFFPLIFSGIAIGYAARRALWHRPGLRAFRQHGGPLGRRYAPAADGGLVAHPVLSRESRRLRPCCCVLGRRRSGSEGVLSKTASLDAGDIVIR